MILPPLESEDRKQGQVKISMRSTHRPLKLSTKLSSFQSARIEKGHAKIIPAFPITFSSLSLDSYPSPSTVL